MFINEGRLVLDAPMEDLSGQFVELMTSGSNADLARRLKPLYERDTFGKKVMLFEGVARSELQDFGELHTPSIADLFVAKVKGAA
jgi:ABC-2 type transport system ATP-binding protein